MNGKGGWIESAARAAREEGIGDKAKRFRQALRDAGIDLSRSHPSARSRPSYDRTRSPDRLSIGEKT